MNEAHPSAVFTPTTFPSSFTKFTTLPASPNTNLTPALVQRYYDIPSGVSSAFTCNGKSVTCA